MYRVEYTDCLGRTRKCLRKDLIYLKKKDSQLSKTLDPDGKKIQNDIPKQVNVNEENNKTHDCREEMLDESQLAENSELFSSDMRKELLRQEWERQEQELMNKKNIHYQDVLFSGKKSRYTFFITKIAITLRMFCIRVLISSSNDVLTI